MESYPEIKNKLLEALRQKEITLENFIDKVTQWTVEMIGEYQFKPVPVKPRDVLEFEKIPDNDRKNLSWEYWADHPTVLKYYRDVASIRSENWGIYQWLQCCLLQAEREEDGEKIRAKLGEVTADMLPENVREGVGQ